MVFPHMGHLSTGAAGFAQKCGRFPSIIHLGKELPVPSTKHPSLLALLHRLKGPALGIANGAPVSAAWVGVVTGYSPETARQALQRLKALQLDEPGQLRLAEQRRCDRPRKRASAAAWSTGRASSATARSATRTGTSTP